MLCNVCVLIFLFTATSQERDVIFASGQVKNPKRPKSLTPVVVPFKNFEKKAEKDKAKSRKKVSHCCFFLKFIFHLSTCYFCSAITPSTSPNLAHSFVIFRLRRKLPVNHLHTRLLTSCSATIRERW